GASRIRPPLPPAVKCRRHALHPPIRPIIKLERWGPKRTAAGMAQPGFLPFLGRVPAQAIDFIGFLSGYLLPLREENWFLQGIPDRNSPVNSMVGLALYAHVKSCITTMFLTHPDRGVHRRERRNGQD